LPAAISAAGSHGSSAARNGLTKFQFTHRASAYLEDVEGEAEFCGWRCSFVAAYFIMTPGSRTHSSSRPC